MKPNKTVTSREFLHRFGELSAGLAPGDSLTITRHGKTVGTFIKQPELIQHPDYVEKMRKFGTTGKAARRLFKQMEREA